MTTAWVRLSRTCQNACLFCNDADNLDGTIVDLDTVKADIDAAVASGATKVVFSGGEPMMSKHFLAAIKHAKAAGLTVSVTTNGRIVKSRKIADVLAAAGLDEVRISVHSGIRARHDVLAGSDGAWLESLQALRFFGQTDVHTVMVTVLSQVGADDLGHLMHLGMMGGMKELEIRRIASEGRAKGREAELRPIDKNACDVLSELWYEAKEEVILLRAVGFDDSRDLGLTITGPIRQADRAVLALLRQRVGLTQPPVGLSLLGDENMAKDCVLLAEAAGGLDQAGTELAARGAPITDAPWCVGGVPYDTPADHWGDAVHYGEGCEGCPVREACPGLPRKMRKLDTGVLRPRQSWTGVASGSAVVVGGADALLRTHTLPALAASLTEAGLTAAYLDAWQPGTTADLIVCGDAATAHAVLAEVPEGAGKVVVLDAAWGVGLADLPRQPDEVVLCHPEGVGGLVAAGIDLHRVSLRPYPVPPAAFDASDGGGVVVLGAHADWASFDVAAAAMRNVIRKATAFVFGEGAPADPGCTVVRTPDDATVFEALASAHLLVIPSCTPNLADPDAAAAHARMLRWITVAHAMGRPVAAVRGPGVEDHVRHGKTAWLAPVSSPRELAGALRQVADKTRHHGMARHARELARSAHVDAWAHDLVHGRLPNANRPRGTESMPWPPYA